MILQKTGTFKDNIGKTDKNLNVYFKKNKF